MLLTHIARIFGLLQAPPDAGSGSGNAGASGAAGAAGAGGGSGPAGGQGPAGGGSGTPYRLTDDSMVDLGDGKPVKWSEARSARYMDRTQYDQGVRYLESVAADLDTRQQQLLQRLTAASQGQKPDGSQLPATDPFAAIEGMAVVDGRTLADLARKMSREGFGQLASAVASLAQKVSTIEKGAGHTAQATQQLTEREQQQQFDHGITTVLGTLSDIKGLPEGVTLDPQSPFLRELAADTWLSHDQNSWRPGEFEKMLGDRISKAVAFVRGLDKSAVSKAEERRKQFFANPAKGNARPNGEARPRFQNGNDLARVLFQSPSNPT